MVVVVAAVVVGADDPPQTLTPFILIDVIERVGLVPSKLTPNPVGSISTTKLCVDVSKKLELKIIHL